MRACVGRKLGEDCLLARHVARELHLHRHCVHRTLAGEHDLIVRRPAGKAHQHGFDLRWVNVHATDDQHVVAPAHHTHHPAMGAPARTRLLDQPRDVTGAIAQHRQRLFGERGEHELAHVAGGQNIQGVGIDNLGVEMVLPDMQPALRLVAFARHAGSDDLGETINVHRLDAQFRLDLPAHRLAPGLRAKATVAQRQRAQFDAHRLCDLGNVEGIGRRCADNFCAEIADQHDLPFGAAAGNRHGCEAEPLGAVVESQAARKQPVSIGVVKNIAGLRTHAGEGPGHEVRPAVEIAAGVADDGRLPGGAGRGMQPQNVLAWDRKQAEREIVAQVRLRGEGYASDVGVRFDLLRIGPGSFELAPDMRHLAIGAFDRFSHPPKLQRRKLVARHGLGRAIEHEGLLVATQHRRSPRSCCQLGRFGFEALKRLRLLHNEACVATATDIFEVVLDAGLEKHLATLDGRHAHRNLHRHAHEGRGEMLERDFHAYGILAGIGMFDDQLPAGMLDVQYHGRCRIRTCLLAHEPDRALAVDLDAVDAGHAWAKTWLHADAPRTGIAGNSLELHVPNRIQIACRQLCNP